MHCNNALQTFDGFIGKDMYFRNSNLGNVKSLWCNYIQQALAIKLWQCNYIQQSLRYKIFQSYAITYLYLTVLVHKTKTMRDDKKNCCRDVFCVWGICGSVWDGGVCVCLLSGFFSVLYCCFCCLFVFLIVCLFEISRFYAKSI